MLEQRIIDELHRARAGSKAQLDRIALKAAFDVARASGFKDIPLASEGV